MTMPPDEPERLRLMSIADLRVAVAKTKAAEAELNLAVDAIESAIAEIEGNIQ